MNNNPFLAYCMLKAANFIAGFGIWNRMTQMASFHKMTQMTFKQLDLELPGHLEAKH